MDIQQFLKEKNGTFECDLGFCHHFSSGLYAKQMTIPQGYAAVSHKHTYDHLSILATGKVIVKTDDFEKEFNAPACIEIKANINHMIIALEDAAWFCIHATEETDVSKIDDVLIQEK